MRFAFLISLIFPLLLVSCRDDRAQAQRALKSKGIPLNADQVTAAVYRGEEETVKQLLVCGVSAHQTDPTGLTPLELACFQSDLRMVRLLLQQGTGNNLSNPDGRALAIAALLGDIAIAKELLRHGANPNVEIEMGKPLLHWCIAKGRYIIVENLLANHVDIHATDSSGHNALFYAFERGQRRLVEKLLALGAKPSTANGGTFTPLTIQCLQRGWLDLLPSLVQQGAELRATDRDGKSILDYAIESGNDDLREKLLGLGLDANTTLADGRPLLLWSLERDESISLELLARGANPNTHDKNHVSILAHAIHQGKRKLCDALMARQASAKMAQSSTQVPPIILAAMEQGWLDLLDPLTKLGADLHATNPQGQNAALIALEKGNAEAFQKLLSLEAKAPQGTWSDYLSEAVEKSKPQQLRLLLSVGIRPSQDADAKRLLDLAMRHKELDCLDVLLAHQIRDASLFHRACELGRSDLLRLLAKHHIKHDPVLDALFDHPLHLAIHSGSVEVLHDLLQHHKNVHVLGKENQTPLVCAIARHRLAMVRLLLKYQADPNRLLEPKANVAFLSLFAGNGMRWYLTFDRNLTPLMVAADSGQVEIARTLLEHGAKLGTWTAVNKTWPLNFACRKADVPMMRLLLRKNPYIETQQIRVSLALQQAELIDNCGNVVFTTKISTGKKGFTTPTGTYVITNKHREWSSTIYDGASMPCFQRLSCGAFGFHQGYVPGYPASHGCLRVPAGNAQKLFELTQVGDRVVIEE